MRRPKFVISIAHYTLDFEIASHSQIYPLACIAGEGWATVGRTGCGCFCAPSLRAAS